MTARIKGCSASGDFREVLGRTDVDAVEICTPDHWHAIMVIEACKARKDIYCQKPLSLTIAEGRAMSSAVSRSHVVFQTGSQQRSDAKFRRACELVRNGRIGDLMQRARRHARRSNRLCQDRRSQETRAGARRASTMTSGSARHPKRPYAPARCHVNFRWIYDYSGGQCHRLGRPPP